MERSDRTLRGRALPVAEGNVGDVEPLGLVGVPGVSPHDAGQRVRVEEVVREGFSQTGEVEVEGSTVLSSREGRSEVNPGRAQPVAGQAAHY